MEEDFDNIPTGVKNDANIHGVAEGHPPEAGENEAGENIRGDQRRDTNISKPSEAKNSSRHDSEGIVEAKLHQPLHKEPGNHGNATDSHPTLMPVHSSSKPRFATDPSAANLQVKTPTNDHRTAALGYNPFKQGSHTVLNGMGNQKPSASNMALSFGAEKLTPTLNSPVQRSSDKLPEAKALMVPVPPYHDSEEGHHPSGARASSAIKKKVPTLSETRFKKKSHLKMMAEVVEFATMAPEGGGKAIQSDQQHKNKKYAHTHGYNTQSRQSSANPDVRNKPELFLKRPRGEEQRMRKIDHEAIRNHANSFMVHQLESDIAREQRRKQFLDEWRKNELHANKSRSQEIASSYRKLYREHLEKSLEYKANATIGKTMSPDAVRERLANRDKYAEMIRRVTKSSPRPANQGDTSNNSMSKVEKSGPARTIFEAIERQRKRSQDSNKNRHLMGNEYMKFAITKARQEKSLNKSVDQRMKDENLQEYAPVRLASAKRQKFAYSIHEIFQSKEPLGLESTHYARLESIRKADNFKSAHSKAVAAGAIKSIDQELAKKEKLGQSGDQLDQDYLRSIHTKLEVLGVGHGDLPKKYTPLGFKPATQRLQSAVVNRAQIGLGAKPATSASPKKPAFASSPQKVPEAADSRPAKQKSPRQTPQKPLKPQPGGDSTQQLQVLQPNNTRKQLSSMSPTPKADGSPPPAKDKVLASKKQSQQRMAANQQSKNLTSLERLPPHQNSMGQLSAAGVISKEMLPQAVLADPLIKGLSRDLDADPSESMRASHQAKLKKELGDFFERQQTGSLADEARKVRESQKALDEF